MSLESGYRMCVQRSSRRVALIADVVPEDLAAALWSRPEELATSGEPLRCVGIRRTVQIRADGRSYVLKHYVEPSWRHAIKQAVQTSRARVTWNVSHRLADAGVRTPRPVACIENRWGPLRRDSFLVYPYVEGNTFRAYLDGDVPTTGTMIDNCWQQLSEMWRQLAQLKMSLGDANLANFIVDPSGALWVIDLDKTRSHRFAALARRAHHVRWQQVLRSAGKCAVRAQAA